MLGNQLMDKFIVIILLLLLSSCVKVSMPIHEIEKQFNDNPKISNNAISPDNRFHLFVLEDGTVFLKNLQNQSEKILSPPCSECNEYTIYSCP